MKKYYEDAKYNAAFVRCVDVMSQMLQKYGHQVLDKLEQDAPQKVEHSKEVYVCSPYAGDIENNVKNAKAYSRYAVKENAIPVTPHLLYPQFMDDGNDAEREMATHFNYVLLGKCTELWVFGGVVSRGMAREIGVAKKRRMKIRWFDHAMKEVNEYA